MIWLLSVWYRRKLTELEIRDKLFMISLRAGFNNLAYYYIQEV